MIISTLFHRLFIEKPTNHQENNYQHHEQLPANIEQILEETKVEDGWQGLSFYPKLMRSYADNFLYMTGYEKPLTKKPITGFEIKEIQGKFSIHVHYASS